MQLVIGGAFSGKRKVVKATNEQCSWVSAYDGDMLADWKTKWRPNTTLVVEGWEKWIATELENSKNNDDIRVLYKEFLQGMSNEEKKRNDRLVLIMLEVGKGIVPLQKEERRIRDLAGWIAQDAAKLSDEVDVVWNGLSKRLK